MPYSIGDVVSGVVTALADDGGLWLDVSDVIGSVRPGELSLADGESAQDRYAVGDTVDDLFVWQINDSRSLALSVRRNAPGYVEALNAHSVGEVVSATVTAFGGRGLWLDVGGAVGWVGPQELSLADGETAQDRYTVGDTVHDLFVWQVNRDTRDLHLSVRRNAPGYVETLNAHSVGEVVSATVTAFQGNGGLWLDVDGVIGSVGPGELSLADGETAQDHYTVGDTVHDLFVWQINDNRSLALSVRRNAPGYVEALNAHKVGEVVSATITDFQGNGGLWLDVGGVIGSVGPQELALADGESAQDRYAVGDTVDDLFVWQIDDNRSLALSVRRNAPGYVEALNAHSVGEVVSATITDFQGNGGLWLDVGGVIGSVGPQELALADGESAQDRYAVGDTVDDLFVWQIDDNRSLALSVRRNAPGYVEALNAHSVGEVVSATVTAFGGRGLWLDVGGAVGWVGPQELFLADGEIAQDHYTVGDTVHDLFVWQINDNRSLALSVRRNAPGYVEALNAHKVGEVVSATITDFQGNGGLWLDVGGVIGSVGPQELALADGESAQDRYAVGDTVHDLFVWQINDNRSLALSVRRNAPGYVEALNAHSVGEVVSATVTAFGGRGLWLDVGGAVGWVGPQDLSLAAGESAQDRYAVGDTVDDLFVWQIDDNRSLALSVRRNAPGYVEALTDISAGDRLDGIVAWAGEWGVWLHVASVLGWIPARELELGAGELPRERYTPGDPITAQVWQIDQTSRTIILSVRRFGPDSPEEPIAIGATIDAVVRGSMPRGIRSPIRVLAANTEVWIPPHALSLSATMPSRFHDGQVIPVVVTKLDEFRRPAELSHRRALDRWEPEMQRLSRGTVVPAARLLASGAISETEGRAAADLGPITGFIPADELDSDMAQNLMTHSGNETYAVVVQSVDVERGTAIVSHEEFPARWRELAAEFQEGVHVDAELRDIDGRDALLDLGSGLLATLPVDQLPRNDGRDETREGRIGESFTVQIVSIEPDTHTITANIKNYHLVEMILADETLTCELKAVFLASTPNETNSQRQKRQDTNRAVVRAMAGMMNREGGHVLVGVEDTDKKKGEVIGWDKSGFKNQNAMTTALAYLVSEKLSAAAGGLFDPRFETLPDGNEILDIACEPAEEPIFLSDNKGEEFPLRYPAMTKALAAREQHEYIRERF